MGVFYDQNQDDHQGDHHHIYIENLILVVLTLLQSLIIYIYDDDNVDDHLGLTLWYTPDIALDPRKTTPTPIYGGTIFLNFIKSR